jgi:hypothetical protein
MRSFYHIGLLRLTALLVSSAAGTMAQSTPGVSNITCNPTTVNAGASAACVVTLTAAAPVGGAAVNLSRNSLSLAIPPTATIPAGSLSTTFPVAVSVSAVSHSATVTGSYGGTSKSVVLSVVSTTPQLVSFVCTPTSATAGQSLACNVGLSLPALSTGAAISISSSSASVIVPRVTIPAGATSASFSAAVSSSAPSGAVALTAIYLALSKRVTINIGGSAAAPAPPALSGLTCSPSSVTAGAGSNCTVTLSSAAPTGGVVVTLTKTGTGFTVPGSVTVASGATVAQFAVTTTSSTPAQTAGINAVYNSSTKTASLVIVAASVTRQVSGITCSPTSITAGAASVCTVTISSSAPSGGVTVGVSTSASGVTVPASVVVPANAIVASFSATTAASTPAQTATITAVAGGVTKSASISITSGAGSYRITSFSCSPTTIIPDQSARCLVYLSAEAPAGGLTAYLKSTSADISVPDTTAVPATASIFQFYAKGAADAVQVDTATITVTVQGQSATTTVTINPNPPFYLRGNTTEISALTNGGPVYPTAAPADLPGKLGVRGNGYLSFTPVTGSSGITFRTGGSQNTNTAFVDFTGASLGSFFDTEGEVSFVLKSGYTFAERQALASPNHRYAFEVHDGSSLQFAFVTYTAGGKLTFVFTTRGISTIYTVPAGQEDRMFGQDVVAKIRFKWTASASELYINDALVRSSTFMPIAARWSSISRMTIGAHTTLVTGGGNYALDDAIAEFKVR